MNYVILRFCMEIHEAKIERVKSDHKNELKRVRIEMETLSSYSQPLEEQMNQQLSLPNFTKLVF